MKRNMGGEDKMIRIFLAIILGVLVALQIIPGVLGWVLLGVSLVFLATSFMNFCPLYLPFGISTVMRRGKAKK